MSAERDWPSWLAAPLVFGEDVCMVSWIQSAHGGSDIDESGNEVFRGQTARKGWDAVERVWPQIRDEFNGAAWLAQGGFQQVAIGVEFRDAGDKRRRTRRVRNKGRLLMVDVSAVCPELRTAKLAELEPIVRGILLDALALAGTKKDLGPLPAAGEPTARPAIPLWPLEADEEEPFFEEPGDCFVITRELPDVDDPAGMSAVFQRYEDDLDRVLSEEGLAHVIEAESSLRAVRWVVRVPRQ
jgi:hypothetical protein